MRSQRTIGALLVGCSLLALATGPAPAEPDLRAGLEAYRRPQAIPHPASNAPSEARVELGRLLFFDPRLSRSGVTSCATCHNPGFAWGDGLALGIGAGMRPLKRRTPTILDVAWAESLFWDGRAETLEAQALEPIRSTDEMDLALDEMVQTVEGIAGYRPLFARAYPGEPISQQTVAKAIATFERTVVSGTAPFDRWVAGDEGAITASAKRGFQLFDGKARCARCHSGWRFTDDSFHDIGVPGDDLGRGALFADVAPLQHAFKTPTLRNVAQRAPYMHDGSEPDLAAVIELYDLGGRVKRPSLSDEMRALSLTQTEKDELLAFLSTLTGDDTPIALANLPR
jgi:cytochrome c peroxidase